MAKIPETCLSQFKIYAFDILVRRSMIIASSNSITTGMATKNSESGSGGDKNAPNTKAVNQICLRYWVICCLVAIPKRNVKIVTTGAWKPTTHARARLTMKPTYPASRHSVVSPAFCASSVKYCRIIGVKKFHE